MGRVRVALTFDDGPDPEWTPAILDAFKDYGGHGTFFVLGCNVEKYPWVTARAIREGHEIGVHGFTHKSWTHLEGYELRRELEETIRVIQVLDPEWKPKWCRPPHHARDDLVDQVVRDVGLQRVGTTLDPGDWFKDAEGTEHHIRRCLHEDANIDLHDAVDPNSQGTRVGTVIAVRNLLSDGTIQSVTVSECSAR